MEASPASLVLPAAMFFFFLVSVGEIAAGESERACTPPRGWNSYDSFSWIIDEESFLENADILSKRLLQYGYEYAVVDFLWYRKNVDGSSIYAYGYDNIDKWGRVFPDPDRWPSSKDGNGLKEVARKVHNMGLKFGIHLMNGISKQAFDANTPILDVSTGEAFEDDGRVWRAKDIGMAQIPCKWMDKGFMSVNADLAAGRAFLRSLYQQYADWNVDFVKLDCVFGDDLDKGEIVAVSQLIEGLDRPMLLSLSPGTRATPSMAEGISHLVNMYRITGDDWDTWGDVVAHFDVSRDFAAANKIGSKGLKGVSWPDLDMLPLGWLTDPGVRQGPHRYCRLTLDEQRTQMTLWSMVKSPLMFGGDLRRLDDTTFSLITNNVLLEINTYSSKNMEFPHVFAEELRDSRVVIQRIMGSRRRGSTTVTKKTVGLISCRSENAKGWAVSTSDRDFDQICFSKRSDNQTHCLYKQKTLIKLDKEDEDEQDYQGSFQLLANREMAYCLGTYTSKKRSASEIVGSSLSSSRRNCDQMWRLDGGALANLDTYQCATIGADNAYETMVGVRSWIAVGRTGEVYLSFFNLNHSRTKISAKLSDVAKFLGYDSSTERPFDCLEIWTGRRFYSVKDTLSMVVEAHGCALFVLTWK